MSGLTTHVLDTANGVPAEGMKVDLYRVVDGEKSLLKSEVTNDDGRLDAPALTGEEMTVGQYELHFHTGNYFRAKGQVPNDPPFLDIIPICFGVNDQDSHYHVPLLVSPYSFSTYRGS